MEATMRVNVEGDIARLRGFKDSLGIAIGDLKLQLEGLTEELAYLRSSHEEVGRGSAASTEITVTILTHYVTATFAILKRTVFALVSLAMAPPVGLKLSSQRFAGDAPGKDSGIRGCERGA